MKNFIIEIILNVLVLIKIVFYYLIESSIFGLVLNVIWLYLFKNYFNLNFEIGYFHFVGILIVYRIFKFDIIKFDK